MTASGWFGRSGGSRQAEPTVPAREAAQAHGSAPAGQSEVTWEAGRSGESGQAAPPGRSGDQASRIPADPHRSPLAAVLAAFQGGAVSVAEVRRRTGLDHEVVDAAVEHLIRMGRLGRADMDLGCSGDGCAGCPASGAGASCGTAGYHGPPGQHGRHSARGGEPGAREDIVNSRRLSGLHLRSGA